MFKNIEGYEFDFNITYYLNELNSYTDIKSEFYKYRNTSTLNEGVDQTVYSNGSFYKNNTRHYFIINPVLLYMNENFDKKTHLFSIISIYTDQIMGVNPPKNLLARILTQVVVLSFFGLIMLLIGKYLINALGDNIVRPLRSLKYIIQGVSNRELIEDKELTKQEEEIDSKVAREDADVSFERTKEIEIFAEMVIKLQNVLKFTTVKNTDQFALMRFIYSKYSFQEVSNYKGKLN
jgi:hypothetical protein